MTYSTYAIILQIVVQSITILFTLHYDWEEVIYVLLIRKKIRERNQRIVNVFIVVVSHLFTFCIVFCEILEFHIKNSSLNLVKSTISTSILEDILTLASIVSESSHGCS